VLTKVCADDIMSHFALNFKSLEKSSSRRPKRSHVWHKVDKTKESNDNSESNLLGDRSKTDNVMEMTNTDTVCLFILIFTLQVIAATGS
jgi:hypothetical protein